MDNRTKYEHPNFFLFLNLYFFFGACETRVNLKYCCRLELLRNSRIVELFDSRLKEMQKNFASFHQVKRLSLLPIRFSMENGELTPPL